MKRPKHVFIHFSLKCFRNDGTVCYSFCPIAGYTDSVYREAHAQIFGGVETYYTPFVRLEKTGFRNKELRDLVPEANTSASLVPQMIAASPEEFRRIAGLFRESGYRRADINLGCPFPMQARQHRGAGILPYPDEVKVLLETILNSRRYNSRSNCG